MAVRITHEGTCSIYGEIVLWKAGPFPSREHQLRQRQFKKDKSQPPHRLGKGNAHTMTKLLVEVNAIKWDFENL